MPGLLADSQQAVLAQLLKNLAVIDPTAWPISVDQESDVQDNVVTIYGTQGRADGSTQIDGEYQEHHGAQIRVRSQDRTGFTIINQLAIACDQLTLQNVTVGSNNYFVQSVDRSSPILSLGKEMPPTRRNLYTVNVLVNVIQR